LNRRPHPKLKKLERLIGRWKVTGHAHGNVTFNWMEGGFFMVQDIDLDNVKGIEFIGHDRQTGELRSHYFENKGNALEYVYRVTATEHIISIDMPGIKGELTARSVPTVKAHPENGIGKKVAI